MFAFTVVTIGALCAVALVFALGDKLMAFAFNEYDNGRKSRQ